MWLWCWSNAVFNKTKKRMYKIALSLLAHSCPKIRDEAAHVLLCMVSNKENTAIRDGAFSLITASDIFGYILMEMLQDHNQEGKAAEIVIELLKVNDSNCVTGEFSYEDEDIFLTFMLVSF